MIRFLLLALAAGVPLPASGQGRPPISVVFRLDDMSSRSNTAMELRILEAFRAIDRPLVVGVIPFVCERFTDTVPQATAPLDAGKAALFKPFVESGHMELMLHGHTHQSLPSLPGIRWTEFHRRPEDEQFRMLSTGKAHLESLFGRKVDLFGPPWNRYDAATLKAAERAGLVLFSGRVGGVEPEASSLLMAPSTSGMHDVKEAVALAQGFGKGLAVLVPTFHEYDFKEIDSVRGRFTFGEFEELLHWVKAQPGVRITSFRELIDEGMDLGVGRYAAYSGYFRSRLYFLAPTPFYDRNFPGVYLGRDVMVPLTWKAWAFMTAVFLLLLAACGFAGRRASRAYGKTWPAAVFLLLALGLTAYQAQVDKVFYPRKAALTVAFLGLGLGIGLGKAEGRKARA